MDPLVTAGLISAGSNLLGGLIGQAESKKMFKRQLQAQRQFAQQGIRWKVADARAAGISPLVALGASTTSPSFGNLGTPLGDAVGRAGESVGRSISDAQLQRLQASQAERQLANQEMVASSEADRNFAEADFIRQQAADSQVARIRNRQVADPGVPDPTQVAPATSETLAERQQEIAPDNLPLSIGLSGATLTWLKSGRNSPAEMWEQYYGELGGLIGGAIALAEDLYHNTGERFWRMIAEEGRKRAARSDPNWQMPISP